MRPVEEDQQPQQQPEGALQQGPAELRSAHHDTADEAEHPAGQEEQRGEHGQRLGRAVRMADDHDPGGDVQGGDHHAQPEVVGAARLDRVEQSDQAADQQQPAEEDHRGERRDAGVDEADQTRDDEDCSEQGQAAETAAELPAFFYGIGHRELLGVRACCVTPS
ncbi:hypothetical protein AMK09_10960 [Streptomyces sp. CB02488]|nr:hypothetical protein AMK09_10960 [Streptomyces sp. CB02488]